jgi:hypothetical protein
MLSQLRVHRMTEKKPYRPGSETNWKQVVRIDGDASATDAALSSSHHKESYSYGSVEASMGSMNVSLEFRRPSVTPEDLNRVGREVEIFRSAFLAVAQQRGKTLSPLGNQPLSHEPRRAALQIINAYQQKGMVHESTIAVLRRWAEKRGYDFCALIGEILPALGAETSWFGDTLDDIDVRALRACDPHTTARSDDDWNDSAGETIYSGQIDRKEIEKQKQIAMEQMARQKAKEDALKRIDDLMK